jgi:hypothetical protein
MDATYVIPASNRAAVEKKLAEVNRKGLKLLAALFTPITVTFEFDRLDKWMEPVNPEHPDGRKRERTREWLKCRVIGEPVSVAGYTFLATLYHTTDGNIVNAVPGALVPEQYHTVGPNCDHCRQLRKRNDTFVVRHTDGTTKQVGRTCLQDFFGRDPHAIAKWAEAVGAFDSWFVGCAADLERGPRSVPSYSLMEVLTVTAAVIRRDGWVSKAKAKEDANVTATASTVDAVLNADSSTKWGRELLHDYAETAEDVALATAVYEWAQEQLAVDPGASDYLSNLQVITRADSVNARTLGLAASMIVAYRKALNLIAERTAAKANPSRHIASVGERVRDVPVIVTATRDFSNEYGPRTMVRMVDQQGNVLVWWTGHNPIAATDVGSEKTLWLTGTIKRHGEYKGVAQTELSRCILSADPTPPKVKRAKKTREAAA